MIATSARPWRESMQIGVPMDRITGALMTDGHPFTSMSKSIYNDNDTKKRMHCSLLLAKDFFLEPPP